MSLSYADLQGWITAGATAGLLVGAGFTVRYARSAFKAQSKQLADQIAVNTKQTKVLELQATDLDESLAERGGDREMRRRDQASRVFVLERPGPLVPREPRGQGEDEFLEPSVTVEVHNASNQPIYDVRFTWFLSGNVHGQYERSWPLLPGECDEWNERRPTGVIPAEFNAVVYFRDTAEVTWRREPDGQLVEIPPDQEPPRGTW